MSSLDNAARPVIRRDETVLIALLLAFAADVVITAGVRRATGDRASAISRRIEILRLRRFGILTAVCVAFGLGAGVGAFATKDISDPALGIPVVALLIVLLHCEIQRSEGPT